ncbi:cytoplasmic dynein 1 light intermediate chain 2 isoform X1 [Coccinella septempunctata]|uniref:cytoplasmic dynein 1 light intermediate chain 2 isoform X1 n=1 Tax=Coccinella septempunctata TaxID=41139 RepID=UPI001D099A55|nr:cytoplasmic dynein 1 light intermediate chain 2 isoform X1 [Coccinella septempunctata]
MPPFEDTKEHLKSVETPKKNIWSQILSDVQNHGNQKLPSFKQILVLGDNESGKTTMVAKLQGVEDPKKGSGLEYAYIDVRDEYRDDHTRLSVWVLDGDPGHSNLLKFALNKDTFADTLVILTVTMTAPWGILEQLRHWASVLADHLDKLELDVDLRQSKRQQLVKLWKDYIEPGDELDPTSPMKRSSRNFGDEDGDNEDGQLPEATLTNNLGLDIVVVVTKTDYMQTLEKEHDYRDEHLDFMQSWVRRFCLQYGAALFYTSAKEDKNCDLLYKYLTHRIYGFPFRTPALVVEKDAVFIPAGWDNMKKISILYENMHSCKPEDYYRDIIVQPIARKTISRETELLAEDEQAFLVRMQQILLAGGGPPSGRTSDSIRSSPLVKGTVRSGPSILPPRKLDGSKVVSSPGGEGVLANFFNSLLNKKSSTPGSSSKSGSESLPDKAAMRSDAAAELDRLSRGAKKSLGGDFNSSDC